MAAVMNALKTLRRYEQSRAMEASTTFVDSKLVPKASSDQIGIVLAFFTANVRSSNYCIFSLIDCRRTANKVIGEFEPASAT
jgi:hypothetical protein